MRVSLSTVRRSFQRGGFVRQIEPDGTEYPSLFRMPNTDRERALASTCRHEERRFLIVEDPQRGRVLHVLLPW